MADLKQLQYFIACVQNGSISKAAQQLYTSQPHVSEVIKKLEQDLSTTLFYRSARGIRLTPGGRQVYQYAQDILEKFRLMEESCQKANGQQFVVMSNSSKRMGAFFTQFYQRHSGENISFFYLENGADTILRSLHRNKADLGFIFFSGGKENTIRFFCGEYHLSCEILSHSDMVLYVGKNNPLFGKSFVTLEDLESLCYVQMEEDYFGLDDLLFRMIPPEEQTSRIVTTNSSSGMLSMLLHTGLCNLGSYWKKDFYLDRDVRMIPIKGYEREILFAAVYPDSPSLPKIARQYLEDVKEALLEEV